MGERKVETDSAEGMGSSGTGGTGGMGGTGGIGGMGGAGVPEAMVVDGGKGLVCSVGAVRDVVRLAAERVRGGLGL